MLTKNPGSNKVVAKVADFGLSRNLLFTPDLSKLYSCFFFILLILRATTEKRYVDNPVWLAPEVIKRSGYSFASDVYAFGVILYELISRRQFFEEKSFMSLIEDAVQYSLDSSSR